MGQCFGSDASGIFPRWISRQNRGYDRFTQFAPKNSWKYADEHLLNEIQDPRSDDDLDFSGINSNLTPKHTHRTSTTQSTRPSQNTRTSSTTPSNKTPAPTKEREEKPSQQEPHTSVLIET